jgi:hypothetical protein
MAPVSEWKVAYQKESLKEDDVISQKRGREHYIENWANAFIVHLSMSRDELRSIELSLFTRISSNYRHDASRILIAAY